MAGRTKVGDRKLTQRKTRNFGDRLEDLGRCGGKTREDAAAQAKIETGQILVGAEETDNSLVCDRATPRHVQVGQVQLGHQGQALNTCT